MITSQRPMMLDAAVGLAKLVKDQTNMTWDNTQQVQAYIERLKQHVEHLARQNNKLAGYHKQVQAKVLNLMGTDLLRQQMKWKEGLKEVRQIMSQVEQEGFTNLKTWRLHWDRQLYKALEHQYQVSQKQFLKHIVLLGATYVHTSKSYGFSAFGFLRRLWLLRLTCWLRV
jgi:dynein heavy chain 2